jgi:hypothetical protein
VDKIGDIDWAEPGGIEHALRAAAKLALLQSTAN